MNKTILTNADCWKRARAALRQMETPLPAYPAFYGVPRGGIPAAWVFARAAEGSVADRPEDADAIVDDIVDSGTTRVDFGMAFPDKPFLSLVDKTKPADKNIGWVVFPWEQSEKIEAGDESATDIVTRLFQYIGEDPNREGLRETPQRFLKAWREWSCGYEQNPSEILKTFTDGAPEIASGRNEMVIVHGIPIVSKCEHHLADIIGTADIAYIPDGTILGLSKFARLADCYARRLQVQERLTAQIADTLFEHLKPLGVGVRINAAHHCMSTRGVRVHGSTTTTCALRGVFTKPEVRAEFLSLCAQSKGD